MTYINIKSDGYSYSNNHAWHLYERDAHIPIHCFLYTHHRSIYNTFRSEEVRQGLRVTNEIATVEPPNKGHFGDTINSGVVSFVERLSSLRRFKMYYNYREPHAFLGP